jgi:hypothetical protein
MTIKVPKSAASQAQSASAAAPPQARTLFAFLVFISMAMFGFVAGKGKRQSLVPILAGSLALAAILLAVSCAGYANNDPQPTAQTYTITVTASGSGAPTHAENITLTVP